jgi:hypothetical protein
MTATKDDGRFDMVAGMASSYRGTWMGFLRDGGILAFVGAAHGREKDVDRFILSQARPAPTGGHGRDVGRPP